MASDLEPKLKRRFQRFLSVQGRKDTVAMRSSIRDVLHRIHERGWRSYIVGGTLRDVMRAPPSAFPRDIDIIVVGASPGAIEQVFADLVIRRTRFGGLHLAK